jgi:hypothetical protein
MAMSWQWLSKAHGCREAMRISEYSLGGLYWGTL